ncbi:EAL domain-containing protein [Acidiphilium sp. PA]|uniref:EAL domain-containing protein n=1 Tax=Acidiphilium sp. PA TaxID=2871705 RepID=UPI002243DA4D|nr:EAL domain-containing protein [Acidiphilium sp. PA]MCW8309525.1 EAL domain-containing protein [Acidiphilium sp. PA]
MPDRHAGAIDQRTRASLRRQAALEQKHLAVCLTKALRENLFCVRYLPRMRLDRSGAEEFDRIEGAELWLGLPNKRQRMISVGPLLRILERSTLSAEVLRYALDAAAADVRLWPADWRVAVPLPSRTLADAATLDWLLKAFGREGLGDGRLDLQIDEAELVEGGMTRHHAVASLRECGVGVTLDRFGAKFGALALLSRLPFAGLKLDRRLARPMRPDGDPDDTALISASMDIGRHLGISVTIDGAESDAEVRQIRALGCDLVQGPWVGRAMPAAAIRVRAGNSTTPQFHERTSKMQFRQKGHIPANRDNSVRPDGA